MQTKIRTSLYMDKRIHERLKTLSEKFHIPISRISAIALDDLIYAENDVIQDLMNTLKIEHEREKNLREQIRAVRDLIDSESGEVLLLERKLEKLQKR